MASPVVVLIMIDEHVGRGVHGYDDCDRATCVEKSRGYENDNDSTNVMLTIRMLTLRCCWLTLSIATFMCRRLL